jgi:hypothetical protein
MNGNSNLPATTKLVTSKMMEADSDVVGGSVPGVSRVQRGVDEFRDDEADR